MYICMYIYMHVIIMWYRCRSCFIRNHIYKYLISNLCWCVYIYNELVLLIVLHFNPTSYLIVCIFCYSHGHHQANGIKMGLIDCPQVSNGI